jgi:hypothetical protein
MDELIQMVRDEPSQPGFPVEANVHTDEVEAWVAGGWKIKIANEEPIKEELLKAENPSQETTEEKPNTQNTDGQQGQEEEQANPPEDGSMQDEQTQGNLIQPPAEEASTGGSEHETQQEAVQGRTLPKAKNK